MHDEYLNILKEFAAKVREIYPQARIWAFGSYARGFATVESDLDICVVIRQMRSNDRLRVSDLAWEIGFEHDLHLSTIVISEKDFQQGPVSVSPLLDTIRREGVAA
jgi:predicted nucleotidyltransferase